MVMTGRSQRAKLMIRHKLVATAGLGVLVLSLGTAALSVTPQAAAPPGSGMGAGMMGPGRTGSQSMDQHFIVMMIPHHDGAIAMADLALTRAKRSGIKELAKSIKASQTNENAQMRAWYRQWFGVGVPTWTRGGGMGMEMGCCGGIGMLGTSLPALKSSADFDRAFIEQMIPHHRMGVMMASMAQNNSQHPQLKTLKQVMVTAQSQEIEQMTQ